MSHDKSSMDDGKEPAEADGDVAGLYSWAKVEGAKYRDFSASRDEARASRRQRERSSPPTAGGSKMPPPVVPGAVGPVKPAAGRATVAQMGLQRMLTAVKKAPPAAPGSPARAQANSRRWAGLQSVLGQPGTARETGMPAQAVLETPSLAFVSLAGGVGKTSLAASIGQSLAKQGERVLLVDTQPHGLLPLIFDTNGPDPARTLGRDATAAPVTLMTLDAEQTDAEDGRDARPREDRLLDEVMQHAQRTDRILIDVASGSMALLRQTLRLSPTVLVVLTPDMASVASLQVLHAFFQSMETERQLPVHYLLNQFNPSLRLHIDIQQALAAQLGDRLLPFAVHYSNTMREALADGMTVDRYAPDSETAAEVRRVAEWIQELDLLAVGELPALRWRER
jgi:cellulose synthase operon protein YhjQ